MLKGWPDLTNTETIWFILAIVAGIFLLIYPFKRNKK